MIVKFMANDKGSPAGKLADAEIHFVSGPLGGLKLIGFAVWERRSGSGRNLTFPARQYSVNGERRSFALLRPIMDQHAQDQIREMILQAFEAHESESIAAGLGGVEPDGFRWAPNPAPVVDVASEAAARELERPTEPAPTVTPATAGWF